MKDKWREWREKLKTRVNNYVADMNESTLDHLIERYEYYFKILWLFPIVLWAISFFRLIVPRHNLNHGFLLIWIFGVIGLVASYLVGRMRINFYSRTMDDKKERLPKMKKLKYSMDAQVSTTLGGVLCLPFTYTVIPYMQFLMDNPTFTGMKRQSVETLAGSGFFNGFLWFLIPVILTWYLFTRLQNEQQSYKAEVEEFYQEYEYHNLELHDVLNGGKKPAHYPMMKLGISQQTGDVVEQTPTTRLQNAVYFGPIGSGKSSTIFIPQMLQDLEKYCIYIRDYAKASKDPTWMQQHGLATKYLNGFNLIDPTNDLCREIYELCMKMGIPEDKVIWLDPENEKTPGLNLLRGPVEKAAENVTNIINGLKGGQDDFFQQSERTHLKNHIYLLKLTAVLEDKIASFGDLIKMYNDIELVWDKVQVLDKYCAALLQQTNKAKEAFEADPDNEDVRAHYQELEDKYQVAWQTAQWFHQNIQEQQVSNKVKTYQSGPHQGKPRHFDVQAQYVQGLFNILDDISKNIPIRRVLFRDSGDFNLDDFLYNGGILLCSTAKAAVGDQLAEILGQVYTLSFQAATFRREPNCTPLHPLYADEFPDYLSESFKDYAAQARKYGVPIVIAAQSPAQLSYKYGKDYFGSLMTDMLTRGTFGDLGAEDAKLLEPYFGEHWQTTESKNEQDIDQAADQTNNRTMITQRREKMPNLSANDIMSLERFTVAVRTPGQHASDMCNTIRVKRIDDETVAHDPYKFDLDNPDDARSYLAMLDGEVFDNPDFDEIDKEIMTDYQKKQKQQETDFDIKGKPEQVDEEKDIKDKVINTSTSNDLSELDEGIGDQIKNKSHQTKGEDSQVDDPDKDEESGDTAFGALFTDDSGIDPSLVHQGSKPSSKPAKNEDKKEEQVSSPKPQVLDREKACKIAAAAVYKSDKHGGNYRFNNGTHTAEELPKMSDVFDNLRHDQVSKKNGAENDNTEGISHKNRDEKQGDEDMLYVDRNGQLREDRKDRLVMEQHHHDQQTNLKSELQKQALEQLRVAVQEVKQDQTLDTFERLLKLQQLKQVKLKELAPLFPSEYKQLVDKYFNETIEQQTKATQEVHSVITGSDDYATSRKKLTETGKKSQLADDLAEMMNVMDSSQVEVNRNRENHKDPTDPFFQQHGMESNYRQEDKK